MTFLFLGALLALPLAGLPVLLHLLFRRKSPIVHFSTLRFIKSAIQHTAARRRIQRWLLLACRMLLLLLLIVAMAQPAKQLASAWLGGGQSAVAAIVVDTSYSMLLQPDTAGGNSTLLDRADGMIQELLRDQLKNASVAIFRSLPPADGAETFRTVGAIQKDWTGLQPQPNPVPLARRIDAAIELLKADSAPQKWLFILTDVQSREFSQPIQAPADVKTILLDLHPDEPRSAGITAVGLNRPDPIAGIGIEAIVEVAGRAADSRAINLTVATAEQPDVPLITKGPLLASFNAGGRSQVREKMDLPVQRFLLMKAALQAQDALPWDNERTTLIQIPPKQPVTFIERDPKLPANMFLRLALDTSEGKREDWSLAVTRSPTLTGNESAAATNLTDWPDLPTATRLRDFVRGGGTLLMCLQPGLEQSYKSLPDELRRTLNDLLPSQPTVAPTTGGLYHPAAASASDPLLVDATGLDRINVGRFVPLLTPEGKDVRTVLNIAPAKPGRGSRPYPFLVRRQLGAGAVYTLATLPAPPYTNLATHPAFLPMAVMMCLRTDGQRDVQNIELGQPPDLSGQQYASVNELQIESPAHERYVVKPTMKSAARHFTFDRATAPGLYTWRDQAAGGKVVAITNVQLPSGEADLTYRAANTILPPTETHLIAKSLPELQNLLAKATEPEPRWALPIVIVLILLCFEALMGSTARIWKPLQLSWFTPKPAAP